MQLEFLSDRPAADAELSIRLDVAGLGALLQGLHAALESGKPESLQPIAGPGGTSPNAFGAVTITFIDARWDPPRTEPRPQPQPGAERTRDLVPA